MSECTSDIHVVYKLDSDPRIQFFVQGPCGRNMGLVAELLDIYSANPIVRFHQEVIGINLVEALCQRIRYIMGAKKMIDDIQARGKTDES